MTKILLSQETIKELEKNKYILSISEKSITYTEEFKIHFINQYHNGKTPRQIFEEAGLGVELLGGIKRIKNMSYKWRLAYKKDGLSGLRDTRKLYSGRPLARTLSQEELLKRKQKEIDYLKAEIEMLKKLDKLERQVKTNPQITRVFCAFKIIHEVVRKFKLRGLIMHLCKSAGVSKSGYYRYLNTTEIRKSREEEDIKVRDIILKAFRWKGYKKGARSIKMVLEKKFNVIYNLKRIRRIMKKYDIICPYRRTNPYRRMMRATKEHRVVPNKLNREFNQTTSRKVLLTDITYMPYGVNQMAYLSTIKDAATKEILAYKLSNRITLDIVLDTIHNLIEHHSDSLHQEAYIHSDQGVHYTSPIFQKLLKRNHLGQSMSRRGNCWDNAPQESFFGHLKDEVKSKDFHTFEELEGEIDNYIYYYNNHRYQWKLQKLTPAQYRNQLLAA